MTQEEALAKATAILKHLAKGKLLPSGRIAYQAANPWLA